MTSFLFIFMFFLFNFGYQINTSSVSDTQGRNFVQFGNMIAQTLGVSPFDYYGYGCWCGMGGGGEPVDGTDTCCKLHDQCYSAIEKSWLDTFTCSYYFTIYNWNLDATTNLPVCKDSPGSCDYQICECDRIVTLCFKDNRHTFNKSLECAK